MTASPDDRNAVASGMAALIVNLYDKGGSWTAPQNPQQACEIGFRLLQAGDVLSAGPFAVLLANGIASDAQDVCNFVSQARNKILFSAKWAFRRFPPANRWKR